MRFIAATPHLFLSLITTLALLAPLPKAKAETDYGQVAMFVAQMLQNNHYSRQDFDDEISKRLLETYLNQLDFLRLYFTQEDVDLFTEKYATELDDRVLMRDLSPAQEIYDVFETRVRDRFEKIKVELESGEFAFDSDRTTERSRKDSPWPKNEADADQIWHDILESNLLEEELSRIAREKAKAEKEAEKAEEVEAPSEAEAEDAVAEEEPSTPAEPEKDPREKMLKRYEQIVQDLDETDEEEVTNYFLSALAASYDPHSEYFSQAELDNFQISMKNELVGIGALLSMEEGAAEIQGLIVGGPADKGGELKPKDRIIGVAQGIEGEMEDVMFMKLQKIVEKIRGDIGTVVRLNVIPADADDPSQTKEIIINRETVQLKDKLANAELIEMRHPTGEGISKFGWINLASFYADMEGGTTSTTTDVERLLNRLTSEGIDGLVLDLRGNGGGSLEEAIKLTGLFIPRGPVVQSKDWTHQTSFRSSPNKSATYDGPMVVLTDKTSASASEILAAALQDYGRAVIVGEKSTFGKGTVQTIMPVARYMPFFSDKSRAGALKVTIQKFYRIAGGSTQLRGVVPDIILPSLRDAFEIGEEALENPLEYDEIESREYSPFFPSPLPTEKLRDYSKKRTKQSPEFQLIKEETQRLQQRIDDNVIVLNKDERLAENAETEARRDLQEEERKTRVTSVEKAEGEKFARFKLTLDNVDADELVSVEDYEEDDASYMRMADKDDEKSDEEEQNTFPHDIPPTRGEAFNILQDLIDLSNAPITAKVDEEEPAPVQ